MIVPSWFLKSVSVQQMSLLIISDAIWGKNAHFSFMLWKYQILRRNIKWEIKKSYEPRLLVIFSLVSSDKCPNLCFKNVSQEIAAKPFKDEETVLYTKKITFMKHKNRRSHFSVYKLYFYFIKSVPNSFANSRSNDSCTKAWTPMHSVSHFLELDELCVIAENRIAFYTQKNSNFLKIFK